MSLERNSHPLPAHSGSYPRKVPLCYARPVLEVQESTDLDLHLLVALVLLASAVAAFMTVGPSWSIL